MTCPICLCDIFATDKITQQLCCKREFHTDCINEWFNMSKKHSCPWCRTRPPDDIQREEKQLLELRSRMQVKIKSNCISVVGGENQQEKCKLQ